jgi:hypothetical protein
MIAGWR